MKAESVPLDQQPETSGEKYVEKEFAREINFKNRVWGELLDSIRKHDFEKAKEVKAVLDAQSRERNAQFEITPYQTLYLFNNRL